MINKFTELINQGVAAFNYTPIAPTMTEQDHVCRFYNNVWSIPSDTHMHLLEDGTRVITGHMIANTEKWTSFVCASNWGAVTFKTTGYWSLCSFLQENGLCGDFGVLNGDTVYIVKPIEEIEKLNTPVDTAHDVPTSYTTTESQIPQPLADLVVDRDVLKIHVAYKNNNLYDVANALNENLYIKGNEWTVNGDKLVCPIGNKICIL